ncbi:xanthine dehydrogenase family protein molybdopterin-binding subunit [Paraburkholderia sp. RL17-337-BIB-A]|uniref:hypothetical protein n=1 Tax=Paraburkholderia sp. RL17-337-BIB-A TaxID=3031636 RepID=UPI0038BB028F
MEPPRHTCSRRRVRKGHRAAQFASDFVLPGLAYASVVTSHIARGRIVRFELACARAADSVIGFFAHADLGNANLHVPHLMAGG